MIDSFLNNIPSDINAIAERFIAFVRYEVKADFENVIFQSSP